MDYSVPHMGGGGGELLTLVKIYETAASRSQELASVGFNWLTLAARGAEYDGFLWSEALVCRRAATAGR